jgi:hypothetical protein
MTLRPLALGLASAAFVAAMASAPGASAASDESWPPGNCPQDNFCVWSDWVTIPDSASTEPSVVTDQDWTGEAAALTYYNYTSRNADLEYLYTLPDGSQQPNTLCVPALQGNIFYLQVEVTKVTFRDSAC